MISDFFPGAIFWFFVSLTFAFLEVEIEGGAGWARNLPTWRLSEGLVPRIYSKFMSGRPLTGYHLFAFSFLFLFTQAPIFGGLFVEFSWSGEVAALAKFFAVGMAEDFLWFVVNPHFTIWNFKKEKVEWHSKDKWIFGLFPLGYALGYGVSLGLFCLAAFLGSFYYLVGAVTMFAVWILLFFVVIIFSPVYHFVYWRLRK